MSSEVFNDLLSFRNVIWMAKQRRVRWAGHVARIGAKRKAYRVLSDTLKIREHFGRDRRRFEDNTKLDQTLYYPTNALNYMNFSLLKTH